MPDYKSIVVLTGAGISAESGIPTFRASDGLWHNHNIQDVATPEGYKRNPDLVQQFYNERRQHLLSNEINPNTAHVALGELEAAFEGDFLLVTQNIDNLHERGGNHKMIHMHGELLKMRCTASHEVYPIHNDLETHHSCDCCEAPAPLRPHIVWFNEYPMQMSRIETALSHCDLFISIGTSGNVYPAAGFVEIANDYGAETMEINLEPSRQKTHFKHSRYGQATKVVPQLVAEILG